MKRVVLPRKLGLWLAGAILALLIPASIGEKPLTNTTGAIDAIDSSDQTIKIKLAVLTRTFHITEDTKLSTFYNMEAKLDDLKIGRDVKVSYREDNKGELWAISINQIPMTFNGKIDALDATERKMGGKGWFVNKKFALADNCKFLSAGGKDCKLKDLKIGQDVHVLYEDINGVLLAHQVELQYPTYSGNIVAVDVPARTLAVQRLLATRKFNVADDCKIVTELSQNASLTDLRIDMNVNVKFEDVNGVFIAHSIMEHGAAKAQQAKAK